jgi:hypothetical protein
VSFTAIAFCVASQRVFIVVSMYFFIDSVRKLVDTPSYKPSSGSEVTRGAHELDNVSPPLLTKQGKYDM